MSVRFQAFNPTYQNISNRINRLKHNSNGHSALPASTYNTHSIPKNINLFTVQTTTSKRRVSPTAITFTEDKFNESGKFTGRVAKNVGIKKYNQRQLKEVMECKLTTPLRAQCNQNYRFKTETTPIKQLAVNSTSLKAWRWQKADEININQQQQQTPKNCEFEKQLIPGKLYTKNYLLNLLRQ